MNLTPTFVKFENPGDQVKGTYLGRSSVETQFGTLMQHYLIDDDGVLVLFNSTYQLLQVLSKVPPGMNVTIQYDGLSPNKTGNGWRTKMFTVSTESLTKAKLIEAFKLTAGTIAGPRALPAGGSPEEFQAWMEGANPDTVEVE